MKKFDPSELVDNGQALEFEESNFLNLKSLSFDNFSRAEAEADIKMKLMMILSIH